MKFLDKNGHEIEIGFIVRWTQYATHNRANLAEGRVTRITTKQRKGKPPLSRVVVEIPAKYEDRSYEWNGKTLTYHSTVSGTGYVTSFASADNIFKTIEVVREG